MVLLFLLLPLGLKDKTPYFTLFLFISFSLIRLPNGSDAHVNLCPPEPHLHCCPLYLSLYLSFQTTGLTAQWNIQHIHPWQIFMPTTKGQISLFWCNTKGLCQPKDFGYPVKGVFSEAGSTLPAHWEREGCSVWTPWAANLWIQRIALNTSPVFYSAHQGVLFSLGNSAPCERSHCSHFGLLLPRKPHVFWQVNSIAHSCCLLSAFLPVETSVFC